MRWLALCLTLLLTPGTLAAQSSIQPHEADVPSVRPSARIGVLLIGRGGSSTEYDFYGYAGAVTLARSPYHATVYLGYATEFQITTALRPPHAYAHWPAEVRRVLHECVDRTIFAAGVDTFRNPCHRERYPQRVGVRLHE